MSATQNTKSTSAPGACTKLPNFLIIGAAKAGTTTLAAWLNQHPEVYMTPEKEPKFFALEGRKLDFAGPGDTLDLSRLINNLPDYERQFEGVRDEKAVGEASVWYLCCPEAAPRIKHYVPEAKLIAILRDPAERAFSNFAHLVRDNREPVQDFERALDEEPARIAANWEPFWQYQQIGFYHRQLTQYYALFPREQIRIYLFEDLKKPSALLSDVFGFLGVDPSFQPQTSGRHNVSGVPKNRGLHDWLTQPNWPKTLLKRLLPASLLTRLKRVKLGAMNRNLARQEISAAAHARLRALYREDTLRLQDLLGRDLSAWLKA